MFKGLSNPIVDKDIKNWVLKELKMFEYINIMDLVFIISVVHKMRHLKLYLFYINLITILIQMRKNNYKSSSFLSLWCNKNKWIKATYGRKNLFWLTIPGTMWLGSCSCRNLKQLVTLHQQSWNRKEWALVVASAFLPWIQPKIPCLGTSLVVTQYRHHSSSYIN